MGLQQDSCTKAAGKVWSDASSLGVGQRLPVNRGHPLDDGDDARNGKQDQVCEENHLS